MASYIFAPLSKTTDVIRLLRLLPSDDTSSRLSCELFEFPLQASDENYQPYEALSYVWGGEEKPCSVLIDELRLGITSNLDAALRRLRHKCLPRVLWIDAVCINQYDNKEKEGQIRFMTIIYAKASRVLVWLGEAADASDEAIEFIRHASMPSRVAHLTTMDDLDDGFDVDESLIWMSDLDKSKRRYDRSSHQPPEHDYFTDFSRHYTSNEKIRVSEGSNSDEYDELKASKPLDPVIQLLKRSWFQRIWVLQEVAAARHLLIICGSAVLDGHTFCVGVVALSLREKTAALQLTRLMSQTPFKGRHRVLQGGNHSLSLFSLGELIDMYGRQQATKCHDRIFALLGMSSDADLSLLHIGYDRPIGDLISAVVKHVFGEKVTVKAIQEQSHVAILQCVGCILGQIRPWSSSPWGSSDPESGGAKIKVAARGNFNGGAGMQSIHNITIKEPWHLSTAANPVKWGDLLYLCDGASRPCIIRPWSKHCFNVIATVVQCPEYKESVWSDRRLHARNLLLTWDWMHSEDNLDILEASRHPSALIQLDPVQRAINFWTFAQILGDLGDVREAQELLAETVPKAQAQIPEEEKLGLASSNRTVPLLWACNCGYEKVVSRLLAENAETEVKDWLYRTPLWLAISGNHGHIANMLLERGADVHACNCGGWQPFSVAVVKGSVEAMQVLVAAGADVNETCYTEFSPLSWISDLKHKEVIAKLRPRKRLKEEEFGGWTPLHLAAALGHATMVVELIDMGANIDAITNDGHSSLLLAIQFEHGDTVAALTGEGASAIKRHDRGLSPLQAAVQSGSVESVSGLLSAGADFQYEDARGSWLLQTVVDFRLGRAEMVWVMLNAGIPLDFPMHDFPGSPMDFIGTKVLMSTIKQRDFVLFELLLRASSDDAIQATCAELRKAADVDDFADAVELLEVRLATCDVQKVDPMLGWQHSYVG